MKYYNFRTSRNDIRPVFRSMLWMVLKLVVLACLPLWLIGGMLAGVFLGACEWMHLIDEMGDS